MSVKTYYENYWLGHHAEDGHLDQPPLWTEDQLNSHIKCFTPYLGETTLDLGCGEGIFTEALNRVTSATGLEIAPAAIAKAKARNPALKILQGDLEDIPVAAESFDSVTMIEVIEHLVDVSGALRQCHKVLKPGGHLILTTTDFNWLKKIIIAAFFWDKFFYPTNPHIRFFTKKTLAALLKQEGFEPVFHKWNGSYFSIMPHGQIMIARKRA